VEGARWRKPVVGLARVVGLAPALAAALTAALPGCAKEAGARATRGAVEEVQQAAQARGSERPIKDAGAAAVEGALEELSKPEQVKRIRAVLSAALAQAIEDALLKATRGGQPVEGSLIETASAQAATAFRESLSAGLASDIEPRSGPLGKSASAFVHNLSASATEGALAELIPGCDVRADPGCLERRLREVAHGTGRSFVDGVFEALGVWPFVIAFVLGAFIAAIVVLGWTFFHRRQHRPSGMMAAPAPAPAR
jgi:hypothetical protein